MVKSSTNKLKFLVLDDDKQSYLNLSKTISTYCDAEIYHAQSILEAENLLSHKSIHLIFIDHYLSDDEDGYQFILQLRKQNETTPIAAMCISGDAVEVQLAFDAGADDFLHKPFKEQKVQKFIKQFIKMA